jgi:hypothetical protein
MVALELLNKAASNVGEVVNCVQKFHNWWSEAESMLVVSTIACDGQRLSKIRLEMVRKCWDIVLEGCGAYKMN